MSELSERFLNGVFKENPTFVLLLGMCPTLAVTTSAANGLGMGITTLVVLAMSNLFISLLRKVIPDKIRIPAFIVIIASFVTMVELLLNAYLPGLYKNLGLYIPLIVVNCIILGRAEAYAYSHSPLLSLFDGLGMGTGFTLALTIIGAVRELLGTGSIFDFRIMPKGYVPVSIFIMAPGAFFVLALLTAIQNKIKEIGERKGKDMSKIQSGCGHDCLNCNLECATPDIKAAALKTSEPEATESSEEDKAAESEDKTEKNKKDKKIKSRDKKRDGKDKKVKKPVAENAEEDTAPVTPQESTSEEPVKASEPEPVEEVKPSEPEAPKTVSEEKTEEVSAPVTEPVSAEATASQEPVKPSETPTSDTEDELEFLDFSDLKKAIKSGAKDGKKPVRKKASFEKAKAMLEKAEESLKEEQHD
ncbi:MAG: electron transport complex subunit RsxE [Lachnospiraceae bacterium]|nr:electron transport complex subunit RsxE [Lachnospiraceae bacterium]